MYATVGGCLPWQLDSGIHARNDEQNTFSAPSPGERELSTESSSSRHEMPGSGLQGCMPRSVVAFHGNWIPASMPGMTNKILLRRPPPGRGSFRQNHRHPGRECRDPGYRDVCHRQWLPSMATGFRHPCPEWQTKYFCDTLPGRGSFRQNHRHPGTECRDPGYRDVCHVGGCLPWQLDSGIHARNDEQDTFATPSPGEREFSTESPSSRHGMPGSRLQGCMPPSVVAFHGNWISASMPGMTNTILLRHPPLGRGG